MNSSVSDSHQTSRKMKIAAVVSAVFLLLSLEGVISFPASAGSSWTQYLPAQRRAIGPEENTNIVSNGEPEYETNPNADYINDESSQNLGGPIKPKLSSPFSPFMFMKPMKPTFMPPLVDPQYFIDKKTDLLNNLFQSKLVGPPPMGPAPPPFWMAAAGYKAQEAKRAIADGGSASFQPQLLVGAPPPWAFAPTVKPTIVPPNFWSPFAPASKGFGTAGSPFAPSPVDPSVFASKKTEFLNKLFDSLNIPPTPTEAIPSSVNPKPTIVPADFWAPPGVTDPATIYAQKLTEFLDKLFNSLSVTNTAIGSAELLSSLKREITGTKMSDDMAKVESQFDTTPEPLARRSASTSPDSTTEPSLLNAKDKVVDTIIAELGGVKNSMLATLDELIKKQKEINSPTPALAPGGIKKKPGSPFVSPYAAFWTPTAKPTTDPMEPFQKRIELLDQFFEMLTKLQKDVTLAVNEAVQESAATTTPSPPVQNQTSLYEAIKNRIEEIANATANKVVAPTENTRTGKFIRASMPMGMAPTPFLVEPNFWVPDPAAMAPVGPGFYVDKTQQFLNKLFSNLAAGNMADDGGSKTRSIKMAVHQGYQSLPPGSEETLQAGGGSVPQKHEGGGLKLQNVQESNAKEENQNSAHRHHHHNN